MRRLLLAALLATATDLAGLALLGTATWLITRAAQQPPLVALSVAIVSVRALAIGKGTLRYAERLVGHDAALRVLARLRTRVFAAMTRADPAALHRGDALARLVSDVDGVQDALLRCAIPAAVAVLVTLAAVGFTAALLPAAAPVLAAGMLAAGLGLPVAAYLLSVRWARRAAGTRGGYLAATVDVVYGAADLAAFGATPAALARADRYARQLAGQQRRAGAVRVALGAAGSLLPGLTALAVTLVAVRELSAGTVAVTVLALVALAAVEVLLPLTEAAVRLAELRGALTRVRGLLSGAPPVPAGPGPADQPAPVTAPASVADPRPVTVRLRGAAARYRPDGPPALAGVDLDLPPGRRVAVVGPSGSGKSTLLALLAGQVPPAAGEVVVDGADADPDRRWQVATGLLADGYLFHTTMRENLTLGRTGFADAELAAALGTAGLPSTVDDLDRVAGEDGGLVSGGQRQRLLLARALLAPPPVLLLDEPTEGLEPAAADAVLAAVLAATAGHAVVLVTHRLVDLDAFDEVLVLESGRVRQRGRHADLLAAGGWYAQWYRSAEAAVPA